MTENSEVEYRWKKNPNFKRPALTNGEPFIDEIYEPVITEPATGTAQFVAGALLEYGVPATDQLSVKKDNRDILMVSRPPPASTRASTSVSHRTLRSRTNACASPS
jgi:ABC-type transport system substrate-binding protein